jgi:hypothetical protein
MSLISAVLRITVGSVIALLVVIMEITVTLSVGDTALDGL